MTSNGNVHKNSKKVTIYRVNGFLQIAQGAETDNTGHSPNQGVADFLSLSQSHIGPYFESHTAKIIGSGLSIQEQDLLMPYILQMDNRDKDFRRAVADFFNGLVTKIPFDNGREFEIGLDKNNDEKPSSSNLPIKIEDYVRFRHAKNHPWTAISKTAASGNSLIRFYIHDPETVIKEQSDKLVVQDKAMEIWLKMKNLPAKVTYMLTLLGEDERDYLGRNGEIRKQNKLSELLSREPSKFLKVYEDDKFETRYWLKAMINATVVAIAGTSYVIRENNKLLGRSELETLLYLEDEKNADTVTFLKDATQEVLRKSRPNKRKPV